MVTLTPFKGIIYNKEKIASLDRVMSPPYDIITKDMKEMLYKNHEHNYVRLILGKQNPDDSEQNNRYTRAQTLYTKWLQDQILIQSQTPAIYPYTIQYTLNNTPKTMTGFFILLKVAGQPDSIETII